MSQSERTPTDDTPSGDPWLAFGHLVSGVLLYGAGGWLLDRWWGTSFMVVIGILLGCSLGIYATWARFRLPPEPRSTPTASSDPSTPAERPDLNESSTDE